MYGIQLFDDIHSYLPDILYNPSRFHNVQDLLDYIQSSARNITPFQRGLAQYRATMQNRPIDVTTRAYSIPITIPSSVTSPIPTSTPTVNLSTLNFSTINDSLDNILDTTTMTMFSQLFNPQNMQLFLEQPVIVRPTQEQIENSTSVSKARGEYECAICQDNITPGIEIRTISHCNHIFHKDCIDTWFRQNVKCPVCRHDIRESATSYSATSSTNRNLREVIRPVNRN